MWLKATKAEIICMCGGNSTQAMCIVLGGVRFHLSDGRKVSVRFYPGYVRVKVEGRDIQVAPITRRVVKQLIVILHNAADIQPLKVRCGTHSKYVPPAARVKDHLYALSKHQCDRLKRLLIYRVLPHL